MIFDNAGDDVRDDGRVGLFHVWRTDAAETLWWETL